MLFASNEHSDSGGKLSTAMEITGRDFVEKIISGELRGLSPEIMVRKFKCSICQKNFEDCDHKIGQKYGDKTCAGMGQDITFIGGALVPVPKDPRCRITDLLIIKDQNGLRTYDWYGFWVNSENDRFRNIQSALENKYIPEEVAMGFVRLFSENLYGHASAKDRI